jgi:hypothetical protein
MKFIIGIYKRLLGWWKGLGSRCKQPNTNFQMIQDMEVRIGMPEREIVIPAGSYFSIRGSGDQREVWAGESLDAVKRVYPAGDE